ncbi:MAG: hypothetical protein R3C18_11800 [Planctomycetaceae bacterium]
MAPAKKTKRTAPRLKWLRGLLLSPLLLLTFVGMVATGSVCLIVPSFVQDLRAEEEYQFNLHNMRVNRPNEWVPGGLVDQVLQKSHQPQHVSLLEPGLSQEIAAAFAAHPWIESVERVQITGGRQIIAHLKYREPAAFIQTDSGPVAVDANGVVLPLDDFSTSDYSRLPHVEGITSTPPQHAGEKWDDPVLQGSLMLAEALTPERDMHHHWQRFNLAAIVAPQVQHPQELLLHRLTYQLRTNGGSHIVWGHPPGGDDLEPTVDQKIGRLDQYLQRFGNFEQPRGPYQIDIRHFDAISLQPMPRAAR